jgi:anthranilate/para-aminobenzoate synthase component II
MKQTLIILNNIYVKSFDVDDISNNLTYIHAYNLLNKTNDDLIKLVLNYEIIIIGGGNQHLTKNEIHNFRELEYLIKITKICYENNILLVGICLGCQIIAHSFNYDILKLDEPVIGTNHIEYVDELSFKKDKYLSKIDINLMKKVFCFHEDYANITDNNIFNVLCLSKTNVPYVIKHREKYIYGFQFHPELTKKSVNITALKFNINIDLSNYDNNISNNFFEAFLSDY